MSGYTRPTRSRKVPRHLWGSWVNGCFINHDGTPDTSKTLDLGVSESDEEYDSELLKEIKEDREDFDNLLNENKNYRPPTVDDEDESMMNDIEQGDQEWTPDGDFDESEDEEFESDEEDEDFSE